MASQLNPAWQRKPASSSRLAEISARFLGDRPEGPRGNAPCRAIPFLLDAPEQNWVTADLCLILTQRGCSCTLRQPGQTNDNAGSAPIAVPDRPSSATAYCLLPATSAHTICAQGFDHVVLLVSARLDAISTAYRRIKFLYQHGTPDIGIVLVGPRDQHAAWRYFRKLAVAALRYLDVPLLNLGFLPELITPGQDTESNHRHNFLARIGERLVRSEFYTPLAMNRAQRPA